MDELALNRDNRHGLPEQGAGPPSPFTLTTTDGAARAGVLRTAHGEIPTPAFMPVGTKASVKTLHPDEVRALGARVILGNTYHLHFRPGEDVIEELGGLHAFSGWDAPILTDSGGFQVFSLRDTLLAVDEHGVTFRSVYDGTAERFTPESTAEIQRRLGSDIAMCLDVCAPADVPPDELERAVELTTVWAGRQVETPRSAGQLRFGIAQGGAHPELRRRSIAEITALPFDGFALGGLAVGEDRDEMLDAVAWSAPLLPDDRPPEPPERPFRPRSAAARGRLRLSRLRAIQPRVRQAPRQSAGAPRTPPPQPA